MADGNSGARGDTSALTRLDDLRLGAWFTIRDFFTDRGVDRSAALAYITLLSLVPLLATAAALYRAFFPFDTGRLIDVVAAVLPYATDSEEYLTVAQTLTEFVNRATSLGYIGSLIFLAIAFRLFLSVETTFNDIWGIGSGRTPAVRVFSFTMFVFWGPVVVGLGSSLLLWMGHQAWAPSQALILSTGRMAVPLLGLTMVYWLAPHTGVRINAAVAGGVTSAIGLQLLRLIFVWYLNRFPDINILFGSLTLVVLFLVSLFLFWMLVILGAEASYVTQNFHALKLEHEGGQRLEADPALASIAVLTECYDRRFDQRQAPTLKELETALGLSHPAARGATERLLDRGLLAVTGPRRDAFVPGREARDISLAEALAECGANIDTRALARNPATIRLAGLLEEGETARKEKLKRASFADLFRAEEPATHEGE
jgi:membrane protein